jgi:hypothetical protein
MDFVTPSDLNKAERSLWMAFPKGAWVDLRSGDRQEDDPGQAANWPEDRVLRAEVIAFLLLGAAASDPGFLPAVRMRGARVSGRLDLMGAMPACNLVFEHCSFDAAPRFVEAVTRTVRIVDSHLPGFDGARMHADGIFSLHLSKVSGGLILDRAKITGEVCLREATVGEGAGTAAVAADGLTLDGDLDCTDAVFRGSVRLRGARVAGWVHAPSAHVSCPGPRALDADNAVIGGSFVGKGLTANGEILFEHARIGGYLDLRGAQLHNPAGWALAGGGLAVEGGMYCGDGFTARGEVRLIGTRLGGNLRIAGAELSNPGGTALNLDWASLADLDAGGLVVSQGQLTCTGMQVAGRLHLEGAQLGGVTDRPALAGDGAKIGNALILTAVHATGAISMQACHVGGRVLLTDAVIGSTAGTALILSRTEALDVFCDNMRATGTVQLAGARVGRHVRMANVHLLSPRGVALDARALHAQEFSLQPGERVQGDVILNHARLGIFRDDPSCWPDQMQLVGLSYEALEPQLPAPQRLAWLASGTSGHQPQPFQQLAALYARLGQPAESRRVLHAKERDQRATKSPLDRAWSLAQDLTVGYGYQPWRAALWFTALLIAGSVVYSASPPRPLNTAAEPHFNPVAYTLDLLLPVVNLGQKNAFNPSGASQWFSYLLIAAGWILVTTIAAGVTRVLRGQ